MSVAVNTVHSDKYKKTLCVRGQLKEMSDLLLDYISQGFLKVCDNIMAFNRDYFGH
jgi:regulator of sigma D